ncbi:hypothetical protein [Brevibacillus reuszeri]|uniref:hypothetical protein n=1 Tax=Brevibacillus reuszeri TaxID=54915 RepID=UPI003D25DC24
MNYIKKRWYEEFGWVENEDDLRPELLDYVGALVLDEHYNVNWKESSIPNMVQSWKEDGLEETEQEIYNPDPSNPFSPVYYVTVDQGCSERELYRDIMASIKRREKSYLSIGQPSD